MQKIKNRTNNHNPRAIIKEDERKAKNYIREVVNGGKNRCVNDAVYKVAMLDVRTEDGISKMYNVVDAIEDAAVVNFNRLSQDNAYVKAAMILNQDLIRELRRELIKITEQKENDVLRDERNRKVGVGNV